MGSQGGPRGCLGAFTGGFPRFHMGFPGSSQGFTYGYPWSQADADVPVLFFAESPVVCSSFVLSCLLQQKEDHHSNTYILIVISLLLKMIMIANHNGRI